MAIKTMREKIQEQKEQLFLNSLLVANATLAEAIEAGDEVSSGLLSAASSLLKHDIDSVIAGEDTALEFSSRIQNLTTGIDRPKKSGKYKQI